MANTIVPQVLCPMAPATCSTSTCGSFTQSMNLGPYRLQAVSPQLLEHSNQRMQAAAVQICQQQNCSPEEISRQLGFAITGFSKMIAKVTDPDFVTQVFSIYPILQMIYLQSPDIFASWHPALNKHANETWNITGSCTVHSTTSSAFTNSAEIRNRFCWMS